MGILLCLEKKLNFLFFKSYTVGLPAPKALPKLLAELLGKFGVKIRVSAFVHQLDNILEQGRTPGLMPTQSGSGEEEEGEWEMHVQRRHSHRRSVFCFDSG